MKLSSSFGDIPILENKGEPPENTQFFWQGGSFFVVKDLPAVKAIVPLKDKQCEALVKSITDKSTYEPTHGYLVQNGFENKKVSAKVIAYAMAYFKAVYQEHKTECAGILLYNKEKEAWKFFIPIQLFCTHSAVTYVDPLILRMDLKTAQQKKIQDTIKEDPKLLAMQQEIEERFDQLLDKGYEKAGSIHSHCDFSAFHSGVDDADEFGFDGLHITIGNVNAAYSFSVRYTVSNFEFKFELGDIIEESLTELKELSRQMRVVGKHIDYVVPAPKVIEIKKEDRRQYGWCNFKNKGADRIISPFDNILDFHGDAFVKEYDKHSREYWEKVTNEEIKDGLWNDVLSKYELDLDEDEEDDPLLSGDMMFADETVRLFHPEYGQWVYLDKDFYNENQEYHRWQKG